MAVLNATQRGEVSAWIQRWWSGIKEACAFTKTDLAAAVSATDQWIDDNAAAYNNALPVAFRTGATAVQKTLLFTYVALRRIKRDGVAIPTPGENG